MRSPSLLLLLLAAAAAPTTAQTGSWSSAPRTQQVDPAWMENPRSVADPAPFEAGIVGTWDLWVSGGFWYSSDGLRIYQNYTPGAAMNRITVRANGSYTWNRQAGRLAEVQPWFAQSDARYYAVEMDSTTRYMARYDAEKDEINLFFWGVGGHAARGSRVGTKPRNVSPGRPAVATTHVSVAPAPEPPAVPGGTGSSAGADERTSAPPQSPQPGASNPLGVEWRTSTPPVKQQPEASNPLGVEWRTSAAPAPATPVTMEATDPRCAPNPLGVVWAGCPDPAAAPAIDPLVATWRYTALQARLASGETQDHSARVRGTFEFRGDGRFAQDLQVGEQTVRREGSYTIHGEEIRLTGGAGQSAVVTYRLEGGTLTFEEARPNGTRLRFTLVR